MRCRKNFHGLKQLYRVAIALLLLGTISGCYETVPVEATQEITIRKDGSVEIDYAGRFADLRRFAEVSEPEHSHTSKKDSPIDTANLAKQHQSYMGMVRSIRGVQEFHHLGDDLYRFKYHAAGNLTRADIPDLIYGDISNLQQQIPGFFRLRYESDKARFSTPDDQNAKSREEWKSISSDDGAMAKEIRRLFTQLKGTLKVRTDAYVESHNANQVKNLSDGVIEYTWQITGGNVFDVRFSFSLVAPLERRFDASQYPAGTDCLKAFGELCKCSFVLARRGSNKPLAATAYRIETQSGKIVEGCTDAKGNTEVVLESVMGSCNVIMLGQEVSATRCKSER